MKKLFSSAPIPTPEQKPPRFDLRHRTKSPLPEQPKLDIDIPEPDALNSLLDIESDNHPTTNTESIVEENSLQNLLLQSFLNNNLNPDPNHLKQHIKATTYEKYYRTARVSFNSNDWVFTQATALASVNTLPDKPWQITADTIKYINSNGNSWETSFLKKCYKSFIGAMNLKDHVEPQQGGLIYGIIIDAVPRRIKVKSDPGYIYYIDTMIATNRHIDPEWAKSIENGKIKYLSVGFVCNFLQCSYCGHIYNIDGTGICQHCAYNLGMKFKDEFGNLSKISAMASDGDGSGLSFFDELSYLSVDPAFTGACQSFKLDIPENTAITVNMPISALSKPAMVQFRNQYTIIDKQVEAKVMLSKSNKIDSDKQQDMSAMLLNRL